MFLAVGASLLSGTLALLLYREGTPQAIYYQLAYQVLFEIAFTIVIVEVGVGAALRAERRSKSFYPMRTIRTVVQEIRDKIQDEILSCFPNEKIGMATLALTAANPGSFSRNATQIAKVAVDRSRLSDAIGEIDRKRNLAIDQLHELAQTMPDVDYGSLQDRFFQERFFFDTLREHKIGSPTEADMLEDLYDYYELMRDLETMAKDLMDAYGPPAHASKPQGSKKRGGLASLWAHKS